MVFALMIIKIIRGNEIIRGNYVRLGEIGRPRWWVLKKFKEK